MATGDYLLLLIKSHQRGPKFFLYNFIYFPPKAFISAWYWLFKSCLYYLLWKFQETPQFDILFNNFYFIL